MDDDERGDKSVNKYEHGYLAKPQVCAMLGITQRTLEGWMQRGLVPYYKIGRWVRFSEADIHGHLRKYRVERCSRPVPTRRSKKLELAAERQVDGVA
jgi:excisionase family DNA binding protein